MFNVAARLRGRFTSAATCVLAAVLFAGCVSAFDRHVERAERLVAEQKYREAYRAYQKAAALEPDDPHAARLVAQMAPYAMGEAESEASEALREGDYERASKLAEFVVDIEAKRGFAVHVRVQDTMQLALDGLIAADAWPRAYPFALRVRRLYPTGKALAAAFGRLRQHHLDASDAALAREDFEQAVAELDVIAGHEPELEAEFLAPHRAKVETAWADHLVARAERAAAEERLGASVAWLARAVEVADRAADREAMVAGLRILATEGRFSVLVEERRDPSREALAPDLSVRLRVLDGVAVSTEAEEGTLLLTVTTSPRTCRVSSSVTTATQRYQSGTRWVRNPAYADVVADIATSEGRLATLEADLERIRRAVRRSGRQHRRCLTRELGPAEGKLGAAEAALGVAETSVEAQRSTVDALRRQMQRADGPERDALRAQLDEAERELRRRERERDRVRGARDRAASEVARIRRRCDGHADDIEGAEADLERRASERADLVGRRAELEATRAATPPEVEEPVYSDLSYPVTEHVRRCEAPVAVDLVPAWTRPVREQLTPAAVTGDASHDAYPVAGVARDPFAFEATEDELEARANRTAQDQITKLVSGLVRDFYAHVSASAADIAAREPHAATDMMLSIYGAAPEQIADADRARIAAHLRTHYGLERLETLAE